MGITVKSSKEDTTIILDKKLTFALLRNFVAFIPTMMQKLYD